MGREKVKNKKVKSKIVESPLAMEDNGGVRGGQKSGYRYNLPCGRTYQSPFFCCAAGDEGGTAFVC